MVSRRDLTYLVFPPRSTVPRRNPAARRGHRINISMSRTRPWCYRGTCRISTPHTFAIVHVTSIDEPSRCPGPVMRSVGSSEAEHASACYMKRPCQRNATKGVRSTPNPCLLWHCHTQERLKVRGRASSGWELVTKNCSRRRCRRIPEAMH